MKKWILYSVLLCIPLILSACSNKDRIVIDKEIKDNPVLKRYVLGGNASLYTPGDFGYQIESDQLDWEELATVLLAGDNDYDFLILSSGDQIARRLRDIKAYENLNEVEGIEDLLAGCYDYISDAAIDDSGNVWMLPIGVECPLLIYNPDKCEEYDIEINSKYTYEKFIKDIEALPDDETVNYNILYYYMTGDIIDKYMLNYAIKDNKSTFDTDIFKKYAEIIKEYDAKVTSNDEYFGKGIDLHTNSSKFLLSMNRGTNFLNDFLQYDYFRAAAMPGLEEGQNTKSVAECFIIIINPNSKKTKWVKDYLGEVCKSLKADKRSLMLNDTEFKNNQLMSDIQNVYADAEILFSYPYEILLDELKEYRFGDKPLNELISELERKMNMYLNE